MRTAPSWSVAIPAEDRLVQAINPPLRRALLSALLFPAAGCAMARTNPTKPVALAATYGLQIVTRPELPVKTLQEFIAYARSRPGKLSYGSSGMGSGAHFAGEYFKSLTSTYLVHIPYKSTSGALTDIAGGLL